jgi:peptide/nickel transport system permease protein
LNRLRNFKRPSLIAGSLIILIFAVAAIAAPVIAPPEGEFNPMFVPRRGTNPIPSPPSREFPLGLLPFQYDALYALVWGARAAFWVGVSVPLGRALLGVPLGVVAGYYRGKTDSGLMRLTDAFMAFPMIAALVVMISLFGFERYFFEVTWYAMGPSGQERVMILTLILFGWMPYTRLIRGNVLAEREKTYVEAARSTGSPGRRIIFRHIFPNSTHGLIALITSDIGATLVLVASFTFIGLINTGSTALEADWGQVLSISRDWIIGSPGQAFKYWYTYMPPSIAIVLFSIGWSLIGDGLRDAFDPRMRNQI